MASFITAGNATNGLQVSSDNTGILELKSGTGSGTTAVTINASQNVGIGTSTPNQRLNVIGNLGVGSNGVSIGAGREVYIDCPAASTGALDFSVNGTLTGYLSSSSTSTNLYTFGASPVLLFGTNNTERARITSDGNLLVGTTNTDPTFNRVNGTNIKNAGGILTRSAGGASDFGISVTSGIHITFYTDNGSARVTAGNIASNGATTSYNGTSDYRLKDNVQPLNNALNRVSKLRPVTWTWKEGYGGTQPECEGFVAHELQAILPIAVTGEKDAIDENGNPVYQGVDTSFLVATLTAAIQELNAKVDAQAAEIAALKGA